MIVVGLVTVNAVPVSPNPLRLRPGSLSPRNRDRGPRLVPEAGLSPVTVGGGGTV